VDTLEEATMGVMERRKRRAYTKEFKAETVRLVIEGKRSIAEVARDLDLTESALRQWVHQAQVDAGRGKPGELTTAEREELARLRREVKTLRLEREILKKAAAFFAKENG
jgi:transposase